MKAEGRIYRVGISGSYGGLNLGDEAILESIIAGLRSALPVEITVFSIKPEDTLHRHRVEHVTPVRELTRSEVRPVLEDLDLFILGGGGILYDADVRTYLREVDIAHDLGVPVMIYAVSAGPLKSQTAQKDVRLALGKAEVITVRERGAKRILEDAGVRCEIIVTADPALLLEPQPLPENTLIKERMDGPGRKVGISVREPGPAAPDIDFDFYHSLLANAADYVIDRYGAGVVFVPMERGERDMQHAHAVIARTLRPQACSVVHGEYTAGQMLTLMSHFDLALGMRLHFLIFAALQGVPFVGLPYSTKVQYFLRELGVETPPLELVNAGRLIAHIDTVWDTREGIRDRVCERLPEMKRRALQNSEIAVSLLKRSGGKR
ncbi:MAG TPA: polysaccharide pyruvyl transferase family protein [Deltaproteobacteria bacterium]|jgi:polysaccharide pyruvyl transferase CsaB|nr:polysaccharide pyruvyl transferase family protein [Deltaproteobacteria bacterium]HOI05682.1 polysaccharide pyruvyl transferase family protein [Deltaproteobacteria bacterium]